jgi:hypothetical protein
VPVFTSKTCRIPREASLGNPSRCQVKEGSETLDGVAGGRSQVFSRSWLFSANSSGQATSLATKLAHDITESRAVLAAEEGPSVPPGAMDVNRAEYRLPSRDTHACVRLEPCERVPLVRS